MTAAFLAWNGRKSMNPDGLSYLDMASETSHSGLGSLVNGYWSPLYPGAISLALWLFRPSLEQEFPLIHLVNWVIFVAVMLCFVFFLRTWLRARSFDIEDQDSGKKHFIPLAFVVFLTATTQLVPLSLVTPDLCVCGCVFLVAGICCRLSDTPSVRGYATLGFVLGLSYYAKAAMLPAGMLLLLILSTRPLSRPTHRVRFLGTAAVALLTTCAPLIGSISEHQGRFSVGETGMLNYVWYVDHLEPYWQGWTDQSGRHGTPAHPPHVLMEHPKLLEFASPIRGTYPLWFDPSYWYAGAKTGLQPRQLLRNFFESLRHCGPMASVLLSALILAVVVLVQRRVVFVPEPSAWLVLWPAAVCCMYAIVHVENRFIGGFVAIFWLAVCALLAEKLNWPAQALPPTLVAVLFLAFAARNLGRNPGSQWTDAPLVAAHLNSLGARPGDGIAVVGDGLYAFYARVAGLRIVAELPEAKDFWQEDCLQAEEVKEQLRSAGVKLLVASNKPVRYRCAGWQEIPQTSASHYSVLLTNGH